MQQAPTGSQERLHQCQGQYDPNIYFARHYVKNNAGTDKDCRFIFILPKWLAMWSGK
jgi:hypothetical protein